MPRQPRFWYPGAVLHVVQRGNNRAPIFADDRDRRWFLAALTEASRLHGAAVHAYVLMPNHIHMVATPARADALPRMMQTLGRRYVGYFNHRHRRTGTLWEGRYKATLVESERYLLTCMRYVELNPVRARMVTAPADFRWSSYHHNAVGMPDTLITCHSVYRHLAPELEQCQAAYRQWCGQALAEDELRAIRDATRFEWVLGSDAYQQFVLTRTGRRASRSHMGRAATPASAAAAAGKVVSDPT
jgi:putative transposase